MLCCLAQFVFVLCCWFAQLSYLTSLVFYPSWDRFEYITKVQPLKLAIFSSVFLLWNVSTMSRQDTPCFMSWAHFARGSLCEAWIIQYPPPPHHPPPPGPVPFVIFTPRTRPHSALSSPPPPLWYYHEKTKRNLWKRKKKAFLIPTGAKGVKKVDLILYVPPESLCQGRLCWQ